MEDVFPGAPAARRAKVWVGAAVILVSVLALVLWAMTRPSSTAFYVTPTELLADSEATDDYRVNGRVVQQTVRRQGLTTEFSITDGRSRLEVTTDAPLPDAFYSRGSEVVALGRYDGETFAAAEVLAKCPSKFKTARKA